MHVAAIELEDFRSYGDRRLDLAPGVTAFVGPNGAGKTNILEAVHVIARGESSRAGEDTEMIRWGAPLARVTVEACRAAPGSGAPAPLDRHRLEVTLFGPAAADARRRPRRYTADGAPRRADDVIGTIAVVAFFPEDTEMIRWGAPLARVTVEACRAAPGSGAPAPLDRHRLEVTLFGPAAADARRRPRRYTADGAPRRADDVIGTIAVVAFFPEDTDLLASAPSARRRYMDAMIAQVDRSHRADTRAYANVLTQRNALLRAGRDEEPVSESEIAFWDTELVRLATAISLRREAAVRDLRPAFRAAAAALGADPAPDIAYAGQVQGSTAAERAEGYHGLIALKRDRERWQATTLVGPHREDLAVAVAERPLPTFAS